MTDIAPELSVVVPCLNEAETLATCIEQAQRALASSGIAGEIIVADNGSTDGSQEIAERLGARVVHIAERGYGSALMGGIAAARGGFILMGDADASYDFVYSSSSLEHMTDPHRAVAKWWTVLKPGGYLIISVPDRDLSEKKKTLPSLFSADHKHFFLLQDDDAPDTIGLVALVRRVCPGGEIVEVRQHTEGYIDTGPNKPAAGEFFDEVIVRKPGLA